MDADALFKAGKLDEAVDAQIAKVKSKPGDQAARLFLFELLSFAGEWDRAGKQIDALNYDEMELKAAQQSYQDILAAERARSSLFADGVQPGFLGPAPEHVRLRLELLQKLRRGEEDGVGETLDAIDAATPVTKGTLNGKAFEGLRDADDVLGGVLEVFAQGKYFWVPLEIIEMVAVTAPKFPRDVLWAPARLETTDSSGDVFIPAIYYGSGDHADDQVRLGRMTDWLSQGDATRGAGLRMLLAGEDATTVHEWKELHLEPAPA